MVYYRTRFEQLRAHVVQVITAECKYGTQCEMSEMQSYFDGTIQCQCSVCAQASLLAQECWHQVCSPDRQLHCSGLFNMPRQDPSAPEARKKIRNNPKVVLTVVTVLAGENSSLNLSKDVLGHELKAL